MKSLKSYFYLFAFMVVLLLAGCSSKKKLDLMEFATVEFQGLNEKGTAKLDVNWGSFEDAILTEKEKDSLSSMGKLMELEESISFTLDKKEGLSNGDQVTVTVKWDKEIADKYKLAFTGKDKQLTVSDLMMPTELDVFEDVHIEYEGVSPDAKAILRNTSSDPFIKTINYVMDNSYSIKNGDKITVTAQYNEQKAEEEGYLIKENEKVFTVEGIDEYITSYDKIDNDTLEKLDKQGRDLIDSALANKMSYQRYLYSEFSKSASVKFDSLEILGVDLYNSYFFALKEGLEGGYGDVNNSVFMVYKIRFKSNVTEEGQEENITYISVYYKDFIQRDTGNIDVVVTDGSIASYGDNYDDIYRDIVTINKAKYDYEEIKHKAE